MRSVAIARWWGGPEWSRLGAVLDLSLARFCPDWILDLREVRGYAQAGKIQGNGWKLEEWVRAACMYPDDTRVLLLDADTMVCRNLDALWSRRFDLAFTLRPVGSRFPMNAGVVALRVSDKTRKFLMDWHDRDREMSRNPELHKRFRGTFGGINQSSLGSLEIEGRTDLRVAWLDCQEWNCEDTTWAVAGTGTRIVHVKDNLRRCALGYPGRYSPQVQKLAAAWRRMEGEVEHGPQSLPRRAQAGR